MKRWIPLIIAFTNLHDAFAQGTSNPTTAESWGGELLSGSAQDEHLGVDVAIAGDYAYVGAMRYDQASLPDLGAVHVFGRQAAPSSAWSLVSTIVPPVPSATEEFGRSVAVDGSTLVASTIHFLTSQTGRVYVYEGSGATWTFKSTLTGPPLQPGDIFGGIDVSGPRIVVGAAGTAAYQGAAYLFTKTGADWTTYTWQPLVPTIGTLSAGDNYGQDIAIDDDIAVVGAIGGPGSSIFGAVYIWEFEPVSGTWVNVQKLTVPPSSSTTDGFGYGLEIDGTSIIVGAYHRDVMGSTVMEVDAGEAFVFTRTGGVMGAGTWALQATLQRPVADIQANEQFGYGVAIDGDRAVVGSRGDGPNTGAAYVFGRTGTSWTLNSVKVLPTHDSGSQGGTADGFGTSVALDAARNEVIVGAPTHDHASVVMSGAAFIYALTASPEIYCTAKLSSQACLPSIGFNGSPNASATAAAPFNVTCTQVVPNKFGIFFYGVSGRAAFPFQGGHLCVQPPITRTPPQLSGGSLPCSGSYTFALNSLIQSGADPELYPGVRVCSQYWYRDPASSFTVGLSDALDLVIAP